VATVCGGIDSGHQIYLRIDEDFMDFSSTQTSPMNQTNRLHSHPAKLEIGSTNMDSAESDVGKGGGISPKLNSLNSGWKVAEGFERT
jgi:hypothetical protein